MKKIVILLAVFLLLAAGCAQAPRPVYDTTPATLPLLDGETAPAETQAPAQTDAPDAERPTFPNSRTADVSIDHASLCVAKVISISGRRPQLGKQHVFSLPAEETAVNELVFSASVQGDSVLVTLHTENCYRGTGLSDKVSEFSLGSGDEINIAVRDGDTETVYQFKLVDSE